MPRVWQEPSLSRKQDPDCRIQSLGWPMKGVTMAEITRLRTGQLMRGVLEVLSDEPEGLPASEAIARLEQKVPVTPFEDSEYPNRPGVRRREKIVRFSTIAPVKAGWLRKEKGTWFITEDGRKALTDYPDPEAFGLEARRQYSHWAKSRPEAAKPDEVDDEDALTPGTTREEAEEAAWTEITTFIDNMNPYEFQDLVAALLKAMGYHVNYVSPPGPDRGLDIVAHTDPLGATGPRIKVQVKRRADKANVDSLRSFLSLLGPNDVGLFVNTGGFTSEAEREARSQESRRLTLINTRQLVGLWIEHYDVVPEEDRSLLRLRQVHFLDLNG